ncbi:MAG: type II toxin-antitoxin system PemK/MazF family toxin, partial [Candidatus Aminicenantes bacterium]|nr:type II toxin-antitoxin system PemK/MazF family toxin [Candidatus Aminicenantes bacterium]
MAAGGERWDEWDVALGEGIEDLPWDGPRPERIAERPAAYRARKRPVLVAKRYEIWWANLDPTRGAEISKSRPVVIVSLDELNAKLQTVTVCPLTTQIHPVWRSRLQIECGGRPAEIAVDQIRTISRTRL